MMLDLELLAHVSDFLIWKLGTIIRDDRFWNSKATDYVLPDELSYVVGFNRRIGLSLNPLSVILSCHQDMLMTIRCPASKRLT